MKTAKMSGVMLLLAIVVMACSDNPSISTTLISGSIQGKALSLANTVSTIAGSGATDGTGANASFSDPTGIVKYGSDIFVADTFNHTIRKIDTLTGVVTTIAGTAGSSGSTDGTGATAKFYQPAGITTDGANLFVSERLNHTIRKIVISSGLVTTIAGTAGVSGSTNATGAAARFNTPKGIATDGTYLYVSDWGNNTIRKIVMASGAVTTIAGTPGVEGSADGTGTAAQFNEPYGITINGANLFVADAGNNTIRKIVISSGAVTTIAGTAVESGSTDGTGIAARFNRPYGIDTYGDNLFVTDSLNHTLRRIVISSGAVTTIAGKVGVSGFIDGTGAAARFNGPYSSTTTDGITIYVSDSYNNVIRKVDLSAAAPVVTTIAGSNSVDGTGSKAKLNQPTSIATDGANLYFTEYFSNIIRKVVISTGVVTTIAGTQYGYGSADGVGTAASFNYPNGITTDGVNLYIADTNNHTVRKMLISSGVVTTVAGMAGVSGSTDGTGAAARFNFPLGIATDGKNLFVTDGHNNTIRKIVISSGVVTTIAGTAGVSGSVDGIASEARFYEPYDITTDGATLFVTDSNNNTIRKIVISSGVVTTLAGTAGASGSTDGTGTAARFNWPAGITTDGANLFVADGDNNIIRKIVISSGVVTTIAGTPGVSGTTDGTGSAAKFSMPYGITTDGTSLFIADWSNTIRRIQ